MKKKQLETVVLVVGVLALGVGAFLLIKGNDPAYATWGNVTFAVGFLIYIAYSTMTTAGLQKELNQVQDELSKSEKELKASQEALDKKEKENSELSKKKGEVEEQLQKLQSEKESLEKKLKSQAKDAS